MNKKTIATVLLLMTSQGHSAEYPDFWKNIDNYIPYLDDYPACTLVTHDAIILNLAMNTVSQHAKSTAKQFPLSEQDLQEWLNYPAYSSPAPQRTSGSVSNPTPQEQNQTKDWVKFISILKEVRQGLLNDTLREQFDLSLQNLLTRHHWNIRKINGFISALK